MIGSEQHEEELEGGGGRARRALGTLLGSGVLGLMDPENRRPAPLASPRCLLAAETHTHSLVSLSRARVAFLCVRCLGVCSVTCLLHPRTKKKTDKQDLGFVFLAAATSGRSCFRITSQAKFSGRNESRL